jgi:xanthine dehydrogenase accessory factor
MQEIFSKAAELIRQNRPFIFTTVVRTKGSTPQKAGAKMLIRANGSTLGTLGGGCVEGDIWYIATEMLRKKQPPQYRPYSLNEDIAAGDGLVCGGTMYFWIEPVYDGEKFFPYLNPILEAINGGKPVSLATVVKTVSPEIQLGKKLLIYEDGSVSGDLNDTSFKKAIIKPGRRLAAFGENEFFAVTGGAEVYIEGFTTPPTLIIMGGGHVGKAVSTLAATLGYRVIIIDDREEFANSQRFPEAFRTIPADFEQGLAQFSVNANTYIVIATRGHHYDDIALEAAIRTPARYIGLLGSQRKSLLIFKRLSEKGISPDRIREIHAPIGLDIGALTPEELAVSIMGEIVAVRRGGKGEFMKLPDENIQKTIQDKFNKRR